MIKGSLWNDKGFYPLRSPFPWLLSYQKKKIKTHIIFTIVIDNVVVISRLKMHFYTLKY